MAIWKKTISTVMSAALLASLLITAVAPAALASIIDDERRQRRAGDHLCRHGDLLFTENSIAALPNAAGA